MNWEKEKQEAIKNILRLAGEFVDHRSCECEPAEGLTCWKCLIKYHVDIKRRCEELQKAEQSTNSTGPR